MGDCWLLGSACSGFPPFQGLRQSRGPVVRMEHRLHYEATRPAWIGFRRLRLIARGDEGFHDSAGAKRVERGQRIG